MIDQNWTLIFKNSLIPPVKLTEEYLSILVAILGTTISPYLFYWQVTMEAEDKAHDKKIIKKIRPDAGPLDERMLEETKMDEMKTDVNLGMLLSNVIMFFIILAAGSVLYSSGVQNIQTVDQAAKALEPLTGKFTYVIFSVGVISSGLLSIPIVAGTQSYMLSEIFGWKTGLDKKFKNARAFYITIAISLLIGLTLNFLQISPVKALIYTATLYGLTTPVFIALILHIANNKRIMKDKTNTLWPNVLGFLTLILMTFSAVALIYFFFSS
jgi:Mn2+/Fe2+ NRAMP family transporter